MSFILDALKKSEIERQRQAIPGLMDAQPAPPRPRFPLWAIALCALLAINVVVLAWVLTRGSSSPSAAAQTAGVPASAASAVPASGSTPGGPKPAAAPFAGGIAPDAAQPAGAHPASQAPAMAQSGAGRFSPMDPAPTYAPEIPPSGAAPATVPPLAMPGRARPNRLASEEDALRPAVRQADPVLTHDDSPADTETLPSIDEVNLNGQVPEMHIDVHVYATKASDRFVYINMRRYHEGQTLAEGPVLERIRRDGAVLDYRGVRFLLPRQQ
jgi:general secretion pathway protein B